MNAFRFNVLDNGHIEVDARISRRKTIPKLLECAEEILRRLRSGEQSVLFPDEPGAIFEVRQGLPEYFGENNLSARPYSDYYFSLALKDGRLYMLVLVLPDMEDDQCAVDLTLPLLIGSLGRAVEEEFSVSPTCHKIALNRPVVAIVNFRPDLDTWEMGLGEDLAIHMTAAVFGSMLAA